ncbi:oxidoreductase [Rhodococcus sp. WS1]|uniref:PQQ-dependent sugar dehydrogenase n=1 Tax=Rhodococcus TaxID=1827 RepID=UPI001144A5A1|nr:MULTISPECIES: PQQ-dependent sugar dehydrogenase [Rhodococcus]MCW2300831.1 glucose/arabinose dehydrogenase [Rhodococcus erythropolis]ROZ59155.1 oxidoreductase [Rhodococcus sp. WS1]TQC36551.1 oxidoreductase [Rhodococcus sp. WS7]
MTTGRHAALGALALVLGTSLLAGCADFDESTASPFTPEPTNQASAEVQPENPPPSTTPPAPRTGPLGPCQDADTAVIATCLDTTGGLVTLPDGNSGLVAERRTGRIMQVAPNTTPVEVAKIDVDGSGDGGLLDIALSPTFVEDNLIYAYVTTGTDNRVVRIAPGDTAKEVLGGIPRGASGNGGSLEFAAPDQLMVLTGDTGNPAVAQDPGSLAGKLLRVRSLTPNAAPPRPEVVLSGIGNGGGVCVDPGIATWVTDRTTLEDRLQRVGADGTVTSPAWTWPDRPGVGGCIAAQGVVAVALGAGKAISALAADPGTGAITTAPSAVAKDTYGQLGGLALGSDGLMWASTINKTAGEPGPNDDKVVKIPMPSGSGGID